ncbi:DeoR/GlpR family DNA-binding transcription regulator [Brachybacterium sp. NBEC-018]|uniref:DeoR/GlpR family DNA-binding transcription regulator n=1 Tax=Brachybacterium sp. NBEC-018 TaxID=2996004 RepID=UPI0021753335|nr:DeoR/GlpR family DNA-binding transcription regulator [Brachybacterium sp. NBEC-018]UVY85616.1 DeoR/GlpR family DNA-binding transcription regulator [Brachybacterium sp. NBEC-018]
MYAPQRHRAILDALAAEGRVAVSDLAERFEVTTETVRRDLDQLDRRGVLARVHGGAIPRAAAVLEPDLASRRGTRTDLKERIAAAAATLLPLDPEAAVQLDAGTSTLALVPHLSERTGAVVTHALDVAQALLALDGPPVHLLPGRLRPGTGAAVGAATVDAIRALRPEVAFLGCNGFDAEGLYTPDPSEGAVKTALLQQAGRRVVLADSSKAGARRLVRIADLEEIDVIVTDDGLAPALRGELEATGVEVVIA